MLLSAKVPTLAKQAADAVANQGAQQNLVLCANVIAYFLTRARRVFVQAWRW